MQSRKSGTRKRGRPRRPCPPRPSGSSIPAAEKSFIRPAGYPRCAIPSRAEALHTTPLSHTDGSPRTGDLSFARLAAMPDAGNKDCIIWRKNPVSYDVAAASEANDDLPNLTIFGWLPNARRGLDDPKRRPNPAQGMYRSSRIFIFKKVANPIDVGKSIRG